MGYIYLASPYSAKLPKGGLDKAVMQDRYHLVMDATAVLMRDRGLVIYSPILHCHEMAKQCDLPTDYAYWNKYNHAMIETCEQFWILGIDGWLRSVGVQGEYDFAWTSGKSIYLIDPETLEGSAIVNPQWEKTK